MNKSFALLLCGAMALSAGAETYNWTGGDADDPGDWTKPANWGVESGYPVAGDTATFSSDATITSDFSLGGEEGTTDVLTMTIGSGATLTINASISGEAGLTRAGAGTLVLKKANPFKGAFSAKLADTSVTVLTRIFNGGALGVRSANFRDGSQKSRLIVDAGESAGSEITVSIPITLSYSNSGSYPNLSVFSGSAVFAGNVEYPDRFVLGGDSTSVTIRFKHNMESAKYMHFSSNLSNAHVWFEGTLCKNANLQTWQTPATLHFCAPNNLFTISNSYRTPIVCETNDVFAAVDRDTFPWNYHSWGVDRSRININGYDQAFPNVTKGRVCVGDGVYNYGFTSPAGKPAKVILEGGKMVTQYYDGQFLGTAGLKWNPTDASAEFVLSNNLNSTSGELLVPNGVVRLSGGASFTNLSSLVLGATGALTVDAGSGSFLSVDSVTAASGAALNLPEGVTLKTKRIVVGEAEPVVTPGRYTSADYPGLIVGDGAVEIPGVPCSFTGASGGLWSDPQNWSGGEVPGAASEVTIPGGKTVMVDATNDEVFKLTIGNGSAAATLMTTNWNTCLRAKLIDVLNKSTITCAGPFTNETEKARVWIKCDTLNIAAGASIDVDKRGWSGGLLINPNSGGNRHTPVSNCDGLLRGGFGPGRAKVAHGAAAHFGLGGHPGLSKSRGWCYDDPCAPAEPGSGGYGMDYEEYVVWSGGGSAVYGNLSGSGVTHGGGAVRIEATGSVVVNGSILASAGGATSWWYFMYYTRYAAVGSGGSGGSVHITCSNIAGSGVIRADGGNGNYPVWPSTYFSGGNETISISGKEDAAYPGGGGGIAIEYDTAKQSAGACAGMTISAAGGVFTGLAPRSDIAETERMNAASFATMDKYLTDAEPGTLVFSDYKLVADTIGSGLSGRILGIDSFTYDGDLTISKSHVRFAATGATVRVTGNLTIADGARLDLGGVYSLTNRGWRAVYLDRGDEAVSLTVDGDLVVSNDAALAVYAGATGFSTWGAEVSVGGMFAVGAGGHVYPSSDGWTGGSPHFTAGSFSLDADGEVNADWRGGAAGYAGGNYTSWFGNGYDGKGPTVSGGIGGGCSGRSGGHFGNGAFAVENGSPRKVSGSSSYGLANDDKYLPTFCGSGGGCGGYAYAGDGGGIFHLATTGRIDVAGLISANGRFSGHENQYSFYSGTGAGGTIFLAGGTVDVAATATLSAQGGHNKITTAGNAPGCGSGGIISVWGGYDRVLSGTRSSVRHATTAGGLPSSAAGLVSWAGTAYLSGGTNYTTSASVEQLPDAFGPDGILTFSAAFEPTGMSVIVK